MPELSASHASVHIEDIDDGDALPVADANASAAAGNAKPEFGFRRQGTRYIGKLKIIVGQTSPRYAT